MRLWRIARDRTTSARLALASANGSFGVGAILLVTLSIGCQSDAPEFTRSDDLPSNSVRHSAATSKPIAGVPAAPDPRRDSIAPPAPANQVVSDQATPYTVVDYHLDRQRSHLVVYVYFGASVPPERVAEVMKAEIEKLVATRNPNYDVQMFAWLRTPSTPPGEAEKLRMADGNSYYFYDAKKKAITAGGRL